MVDAQIGNLIDSRSAITTTISTTSTCSQELQQLANRITADFNSEEEKVKALFNWVTRTISYDTKLQHSKKLQQSIYTSEENVIAHVLRRKKALCGGYAFLFERLCSAVGIKSKVIHGWTKIQGVPFRRTKNPKHTWNAVWLKGSWQYVDLTWAVSHGKPQQPNRFWFLTPKTDFDRSHVAM